MRETRLILSQTQKIRLQRALTQLNSLSSKSLSDASVSIADAIPVDLRGNTSILKGHGTTDLDGELVANCCGIVERVDNLVYVRSSRSRYVPETGNIVVGRVAEVAQKRWKIDINACHDGILMLSSITLPDGIQRRRTAVDELNMRSIFQENDVISVEIRSDAGQLQARSGKYGKLDRGQLLTVPCHLVKKSKQHFHQLHQYGVVLILGCNGYVWVGEFIEAKDRMDVDQANASDLAEASYTSYEETECSFTPSEIRENICRIANAVRVLSILGFYITVEVILDIFNLSTSLGVDINDMLGAEFCVLVAEKEADRRSRR